MERHNWDAETRVAYEALADYQKAFESFARGDPTPAAARAEFDAAHLRLRVALTNPAVTKRIAEVLSSPTAANLNFDLHQNELDFELKLSRYFGINWRQVRKSFRSNPPSRPEFTSPKELVGRIDELHQRVTTGIDSARQIQPRIPKKKRKREIAQGITSIIFGAGCAVANSYFPATMSFSYAASLAAFGQAARDIIGKDND